jgi:hypothetical protein
MRVVIRPGERGVRRSGGTVHMVGDGSVVRLKSVTETGPQLWKARALGSTRLPC